MGEAGVLRTFVGVPLTGAALEAVTALQERYRRGLGADRAVKWERVANLHLTLQFLGDTPEDKLGAIRGALELVAASASPFELVLGRPDAFGGNRPRVLVIKAGAGGDLLAAIQARLSGELEALGFEPERREFSPHLTIGRVRRDQQVKRPVLDKLAAETAALVEGVSLDVVEIVHFQSVLSPAGATYSRLASARLGG